MCEANAYLIQKDEPMLIMEAVDTIEPVEEGMVLVSIFGEEKFIKAHIHSVSLVENKVFMKE